MVRWDKKIKSQGGEQVTRRANVKEWRRRKNKKRTKKGMVTNEWHCNSFLEKRYMLLVNNSCLTAITANCSILYFTGSNKNMVLIL